jgi:hypothetical protein
MLSLEPFSSGNARNASTALRLDLQSAYDLSDEGRWRFGSYTSWCFHIESTVAAIFRANVSLASVGLIPDCSIRS